MIVPAFIIIDINKFDELPDVGMPENAYIAYQITAGSIPAMGTFYKKLYLSSPKYNFCVFVDLESEVESGAALESVLDFLVSLSFHSSYIKSHPDDPLVLFGSNDTSTDKSIPIIKHAFKSQGYEDVKTRTIGKDDILVLEQCNTNNDFSSQKKLDNFSSRYIDSIKKITSSDFSFFFLPEDPSELPGLLKMIGDMDAIIRRDMVQVYSLLTENKSLTMKNDQLLFESDLLHDKIDSLGNYHLNYNTTIARYKKQITELLKFYKNEYEILPLWYKRFGHIVKVVTGKRSFRSLFDDNVKKYGD